MLLLHADWMMLKNASNHGGANSVTIAPWHTKSRPRMMVTLKAAFLKNYLAVALGFSMDLRLNALRRSINLLVYLVFDLEAGRFKFLGENLLGAGAVENELSTLGNMWQENNNTVFIKFFCNYTRNNSTKKVLFSQYLNTLWCNLKCDEES